MQVDVRPNGLISVYTHEDKVPIYQTKYDLYDDKFTYITRSNPVGYSAPKNLITKEVVHGVEVNTLFVGSTPYTP